MERRDFLKLTASGLFGMTIPESTALKMIPKTDVDLASQLIELSKFVFNAKGSSFYSFQKMGNALESLEGGVDLKDFGSFQHSLKSLKKAQKVHTDQLNAAFKILDEIFGKIKPKDLKALQDLFDVLDKNNLIKLETETVQSFYKDSIKPVLEKKFSGEISLSDAKKLIIEKIPFVDSFEHGIKRLENKKEELIKTASEIDKIKPREAGDGFIIHLNLARENSTNKVKFAAEARDKFEKNFLVNACGLNSEQTKEIKYSQSEHAPNCFVVFTNNIHAKKTSLHENISSINEGLRNIQNKNIQIT
jgi:hypothetical protein